MTEGFEPTPVVASQKLKDAMATWNANIAGVDADVDTIRDDLSDVVAAISDLAPGFPTSLHFTAPTKHQHLSLRPTTFNAAPTVRGNGTLALRYHGPELLIDRFALDSANWLTGGQVARIANNTTAPDATTTADRLTQNAEFGNIRQSVTLDPQGKTFNFGVWLRAAVAHNAQITVRNNDNTEATNTIIQVTTNWQFFETSRAFSLAGKTAVEARIFPAPSGTDFANTYVWGWGAQLAEVVAVSSYPTTVPALRLIEATASNVVGDLVCAFDVEGG